MQTVETRAQRPPGGGSELSDEAQVKGSSIRSKLAFARERYGAETEKALEELLRDAGASPVLEGSWYPYTLYDRVLREIARRHYGGDLSRLVEVGEFSAERALTTTYEAFAARRDFLRFLQRLASLHGRFYSKGTLSVEVGDDGKSAALTVTGASFLDADVYVAQGFYTGAARFLGLSKVRCRVRRDDRSVRFELDWS